MKKMYRTILYCMALSASLTGCYDLTDDKDTIDARYAQTSGVTATMNTAEAVNFSTILANGNISNTENVLEVGFMVSTTEDFASYKTYPTDEVTSSFESNIGSLSETTTYYIRSYAYTKADTKVSGTVAVTTPEAPTFELSGSYTAIDTDTETGEAGDAYTMTVAFAEGSQDEIEITNLWDGGMTIKAEYDAATGRISIPSEQVIYLHPSYGNVWLEESQGNPTVAGQFTAKGGYLEIAEYAAVCEAGLFGYQTTSMAHQ